MNFPPPKWVREAADKALEVVACNHYSHPKGRIRLREAIKNHYSKTLNRDLDVETEVLVTSGANEGERARRSRHVHRFTEQLSVSRSILRLHGVLGARRRSDHV